MEGRPWNFEVLANIQDFYVPVFRHFFAIWTRGSFAFSGLLPPRRPCARAALSPAWVCSWMSRRSNLANDEKKLNINSPDAVVVSMAPSQIDRKPTLRSRKFSIAEIRWGIDRLSRSSRHLRPHSFISQHGSWSVISFGRLCTGVDPEQLPYRTPPNGTCQKRRYARCINEQADPYPIWELGEN